MRYSNSYLFVEKCLSKFLINILYTPSAVGGLLQASPIEQRPPFKSCHITIGISHTPVTKEHNTISFLSEIFHEDTKIDAVTDLDMTSSGMEVSYSRGRAYSP